MADTTASALQSDKKPNSAIGNVRWSVCTMLFAATSINYMDRQVIAILKPTLENSIGLTEIQYGYIVDAFQVAYAVGLLAAGSFIDRFGSRLGYAIVMAVWSVAAMGHALASTAWEFATARFMLGLGEAGNFPAAVKAVAEWFPKRERSFAMGILNSGANVGAILAPLLVPWVTLHYGWQAAFLITGLIGVLWIIPWLRWYHRPSEHKFVSKKEVLYISEGSTAGASEAIQWRRLLGYRQTWAFTFGKFLTDPIWYFYLFWLPSYFSSKFHLDLSHLGMPLIVIYNVSAIGSVGGGWLPTAFQRIGISGTRARLGTMFLCAMLVVPIYSATRVGSLWAAILLISLAAGAHQGWSANLYTIVSDMFPKSAVASVVGIGSMAGSIGGVLFAYFASHSLQLTHSYAILFVMAASAYLVAFVVLLVLAPRLKPVELHS